MSGLSFQLHFNSTRVLGCLRGSELTVHADGLPAIQVKWDGATVQGELPGHLPAGLRAALAQEVTSGLAELAGYFMTAEA